MVMASASQWNGILIVSVHCRELLLWASEPSAFRMPTGFLICPFHLILFFFIGFDHFLFLWSPFNCECTFKQLLFAFFFFEMPCSTCMWKSSMFQFCTETSSNNNFDWPIYCCRATVNRLSNMAVANTTAVLCWAVLGCVCIGRG